MSPNTWDIFKESVMHMALELSLTPEEAMHVWRAGIEAYKAVRKQKEREDADPQTVRRVA
jgi:hypothetical protein